MIEILAVLFIVLISLCVFANFLTLPGNWIMAGLVGLWTYLVPDNHFTLWFWVLFIGLLLIGEVTEFYLQLHQGKKAGASGRSNILGMIGAIIGAIVGVPFFFGIGAILGALCGAWLGTFIGEFVFCSKEKAHAINAANAAMWGKFLGMIIKFAIGFYLVFYTAINIFPN